MPADLKTRTRSFALRIIKLVNLLGNDRVSKIIGMQLLRAATSVGANYRAACRAKSKADFIYKMGIVEEEADECMYWMELLIHSNLIAEKSIKPLQNEANELVAISVASICTARKQRFLFLS